MADLPHNETSSPAAPQGSTRHAHTYDDDVMRAMNATDAPTVQEMLATARERERAEKERKITRRQRRWYSVFSFLFLLLAAGGFGYGIYHYVKLTVPVEPAMSVGVFANTSPVVAQETNIRDLLAAYRADTTLPQNRPLLVPLVTDAVSLAPISKDAFFSFIEAKPSEPFAYAATTIRLGILNDGETATPFLILSVANPQVASKEFLIAEPTLLQLFSPALGIDLSAHIAEVGKEFTSTYLYNMPVRILSSASSGGGTEETVLLYGYASPNVIVVTTTPSILKAVYDTILHQQ